MAELVHVDQRKWPDREHYQFEVMRLGRDRFGTWVKAEPGTVVTRGDDEPFGLPGGFIGVVPEDEWWVAQFYTSHPEITAYVNIGTPAEWDGDRFTQIDLDLDVVRRLNGEIEIIDVDEFEENRALFGYPDELAKAAIEAAGRAVGLLEDAVEPFGEAAGRWTERAEGMS